MHLKFDHAWMSLLLLGLVLTGSSCITHHDLVSFNEGDEFAAGAAPESTARNISTVEYPPYAVRPNDQLLIRVNAFEGNTDEFINQDFVSGPGGQRINFDPATLHFNSYIVNDSGYIKMPMVGQIPVVGMDILQIQDSLDQKFKPYIKVPATKVKLANRRVTVLGEVNEPGMHYLYNEKNTLLETLGLAGDITPFGNRQNVKLIRQTETGVKTVYLNLQRTDFISTPYYYIQPNDVVYIEPLKPKSFDQSSSSVGVVLSGISLAVVILSIFIK